MPNASERTRGALFGLAAAVLFGASAPLAKVLLQDISPLLLSALLYLGAALGLTAYGVVLRRDSGERLAFSPSDWLLLGGVTVVGGVAGPLLLLLGLQRVSGVTGSLLLNLEAVMTMFLATAFFGEHLGRGEAVAGALIVAAAAILGFRPGELSAAWVGVAAIAAACACWAIDNNLTQRLSLRNATAVARLKATGAAAASLLIAFATGIALPDLRRVAAAMALGFFSYGVSLVFAVTSMRYLGAARQAAFFAVAPFAGAALAIPLLGQWPSPGDWVAALTMAAAVVFLAKTRHEHRHRHDAVVHDHEHVHDLHHQHDHGAEVSGSHAHAHRHDELEHEHAHVSDHHHRHPHK